MPSRSFAAQYAESIFGDVDVDELVGAMPADYRLKGMFFQDQVQAMGSEAFATLQPTLDAPPRFGRYLPFVDYPLRDFLRLLTPAADKRYPTLNRRQAFRKLGRAGFESFRLTTVGKVIVAALTDPLTAIRKMPNAYALVTSPTAVSISVLGPRSARVRLEPYYALPEYDLGVVESIIAYFDAVPTTRLSVEAEALVIESEW